MRTVRSFDPCLPCGVHMYLGKGKMLEEAALADAGRRSRAWRAEPDRTRRVRMAAQNLRAVGDRIERLLDELASRGRPARYDQTRGAAAAGDRALRRRLDACVDARQRGDDAGALAVSPTTSCRQPALVHGLHPDGARGHGSSSALAAVRPFLADARRRRRAPRRRPDAGAVHLRLLGSCDGCPSSAVTLRTAVEQAITEAAPEIVIIDVEPDDRLRPAGSSGPGGARAASPSYEECPTEVRGAVTDDAARGPPADPPRPAADRDPRPGERCELCAEPIARGARPSRRPRARATCMCACRGCYLLFTPRRARAAVHFRAVPDRYRRFPDLAAHLAQWDALQIPVSVAFFFVNSELDRVAAFYPGPAGATESLLPLETWDELVAANPELATLEPDVEAFLVRTDARREAPSATSCRSTPATSSSAARAAVARLRRRARGARALDDVLRPGARERRR